MWQVLEKKEIPLKYAKLTKDMYNKVVTSMRRSGAITSDFSIIVYLYQGLALSPYLYTNRG